jgi:hypothetical protein
LRETRELPKKDFFQLDLVFASSSASPINKASGFPEASLQLCSSPLQFWLLTGEAKDFQLCRLIAGEQTRAVLEIVEASMRSELII